MATVVPYYGLTNSAPAAASSGYVVLENVTLFVAEEYSGDGLYYPAAYVVAVSVHYWLLPTGSGFSTEQEVYQYLASLISGIS